jgi:hypothetical protein
VKRHTLKLSLVMVLSLATLAACDRHHKKSDAAAAPDTNTAAATAPAATTAMTPAPATEAPGGKGGKKAWKLACADDIKKFCADADKPGRCLKDHESELSQGCVSAREAAKAARKAEKGE